MQNDNCSKYHTRGKRLHALYAAPLMKKMLTISGPSHLYASDTSKRSELKVKSCFVQSSMWFETTDVSLIIDFI